MTHDVVPSVAGASFLQRYSANAAVVAAWSILAPPRCLWMCIFGPAHCFTGKKSAKALSDPA